MSYSPRIFKLAEFMQPTVGEPIRSVVTQSAEAVVVAWHVAQGQRIAAHIHPHGQDTWTVFAGAGDYLTDISGGVSAIRAITTGDVVVAHTGQVHGVYNPHPEPLRIVSVVSPAEAGYELQDAHLPHAGVRSE